MSVASIRGPAPVIPLPRAEQAAPPVEAAAVPTEKVTISPDAAAKMAADADHDGDSH